MHNLGLDVMPTYWYRAYYITDYCTDYLPFPTSVNRLLHAAFRRDTHWVLLGLISIFSQRLNKKQKQKIIVKQRMLDIKNINLNPDFASIFLKEMPVNTCTIIFCMSCVLCATNMTCAVVQ